VKIPRLNPSRLTVALFLIALVSSPAARASGRPHAQFTVSVTGSQQTSWNETVHSDRPCVSPGYTSSGTQTIVFKSEQPGRLRIVSAGHRRGYGNAVVRTDWLFTRSYQESRIEPMCPSLDPPPPPTGCGTKGPYSVPAHLDYDGRRVSLSGVINYTPGQQGPDYDSCGYEGFHEVDLLDSYGRLKLRRALSGRAHAITVPLSTRVKTDLPDSDGSSTTTLSAVVTLKRSG
jgi:hypothetical protein